MLKYIIFITAKNITCLRELEEECKEREVEICYSLPEKSTLISETLYITDHEEIAKQLLDEKANVLVWLHEKNREQNFSHFPYAVENIEEVDFTYMERIYQRFQKIPWFICETQRCRIREMTETDLDAIYEIYEGESITRYMEGLYEEREKELEYLRSYIEHEYGFWGYGTWIIERKEDGKKIGRVGFNVREGYEEPELGYVIGEKYQRQGYAYECCEAVLEVGRKEYEFATVQALIREENEASIGLCKKLGFLYKEKIKMGEEEYLRFCL